MLTHLSVRDFVIVEHLELELGAGMTVLTGETGAGKSILVDALGLAVGERAAAGVVRSGCERADVSAVFDLGALPEAARWVAAEELDEGSGECILRRSVSTDGRSRAYINARPVPVQKLRELGLLLLEIHGQHEHQNLLRRSAQRQLLDAYGANGALLEELARCVAEHRELVAAMERLSGAGQDRDARLDLLRYQVRELQALGLADGELDSLEAEHRRLSHVQDLLTACHATLERLEGDSDAAAAHQLAASARALEALEGYDLRLGAFTRMLQEATVLVDEAAADLRAYVEGLDLDPDAAQRVEERVASVHALARKHRVAPAALPELQGALERELADLEGAGERLSALARQRSDAETRFRALATALNERRVAAADRLATEVTRHMTELGMPGGRFLVDVRHDPGAEPAPHGADEVEFQVAANRGQAPQPLARVASGGELSRISLALQVVSVADTGVATLIFDEVDAGIGGRVAEIVGRLLRRLGGSRQVLCITHLPQVASQGHHHLHVRKRDEGDMTIARLEPLSGERRVEEIARMLGGVDITDQTLAHAREVLARV